MNRKNNMITRIGLHRLLALAAIVSLSPQLATVNATAAPAPKPNIVFILADDLGYGDLSCQGHPDYKTPNIDRLAGEGIRLTQFSVAAPICCVNPEFQPPRILTFFFSAIFPYL